METMKIHFINGTSEIVPYEIAELIQKRMSNISATNWQSFLNDYKLTLIVNLNHITHISQCK